MQTQHKGRLAAAALLMGLAGPRRPTPATAPTA